MASLRTWRAGAPAILLLAAFACGGESPSSEGAPSSVGPNGDGAETLPPSSGATPPPPVIADGGDCASGAFELRSVGKTRFQDRDFDVVIATPCDYVLSHVRKGVTYRVEETATHYVIDANFELPWIPGVMDAVAFTPGDKNKGWPNGFDVEKVVREMNGLPLIYHVTPGYEYGYFTDYDDGEGDIFGAFRPTWRFSEQGGSVTMKLFVPPDKTWPRHRGGWNAREINKEIGFGFYVDASGKVYVPKNVPLGRPKWSTPSRCVMINLATSEVPITRTQFPGDESYYLAETLLPGYASIGSPGHKYWGHKGKPMRDVAKWDETLPGNFDKPFGGGCDLEGYSVAHAEGFTWPELRREMRDKYRAGKIAAIPKENLYKVSVYEQDGTGPLVLKGSLWYEWVEDEWLPRSSGDALIALDRSRGTYRISGYVPENRRAYVVVEDL